MAKLILMPKIGISVESCIITKWHKAKGDSVKTGELLFSYETDKTSIDEEAKEDGVILEIFAGEGDDVPVLQPVAIIGAAGDDISDLIAKAKPTEESPVAQETAPASEVAETPAAVAAVSTASTEGDIIASPRARKLAEKVGADLSMATPTGPKGRIIERDIQALADSGKLFTKSAVGSGATQGSGLGGRITTADGVTAPAVAADSNEPEIVKLPIIRKAIAKSMLNSLSTTAQLTNHSSFDATELLNSKKKLKEAGVAVTVTDIIVYALAKVLKNYRDFNAHLIDDEVHYFNSVNIGIAVDTPKGLLVPTLFGADKMTLAQIADKTKELYALTKEGKLPPDLQRGATFTISNLGTLGVEMFTPVINAPQTAILGVCSTVDRVRKTEDGFTVYPAMGLSLTYDHRIIDGAPAARFVAELKANLENILLMFAK